MELLFLSILYLPYDKKECLFCRYKKNPIMLGIRWKDLLPEYPGYKTCHRLFQDWQLQKVFEDLFHILSLEKSKCSKSAAKIAFIDQTFVPAKKGTARWQRL